MGLVPTKLRIFQLRRKFLRFVVTRPAREGAVFTAPFEPPDAPCSQPAFTDDSAKHPIRNGAPRTPLAGCRTGGTTASLHALAIARYGHRLASIRGGRATRIGRGGRAVSGRGGTLRGRLLGQELMQVASRLAHVGDAHVAQLGATLVHRLAAVLFACILDAVHVAHILGILRVLHHGLLALELFVAEYMLLLRQLACHRPADKTRNPKHNGQNKDAKNSTPNTDPTDSNSRRVMVRDATNQTND